MKGYFVLLLFAVVGAIVERRNSVKGTIEEDTTWFLSDLSVRPAMRASIEYNIRYPKGGPPPVLTFYYMGQDSPNLQQRCNAKMHGQLFNQKLAIPLEDNFWSNNYGIIEIQDFEPKSYFFSLGFECGERKGNLKGLKYEVTIYDESNQISCNDLSKVDAERIDRCDRSYQYAAIPNQVGDTDVDDAVSDMNGFLDNLDDAGRAQFVPKILNTVYKDCLKRLKPFLRQIFLPKCLPKENKILLPCRDTCKSLLEDCILSDDFRFYADANCDYLPPCPSNGRVSIIIGLSVGACVIVVVMAVCVKYRKRIRNYCSAWYSNRNMTTR